VNFRKYVILRSYGKKSNRYREKSHFKVAKDKKTACEEICVEKQEIIPSAKAFLAPTAMALVLAGIFRGK